MDKIQYTKWALLSTVYATPYFVGVWPPSYGLIKYDFLIMKKNTSINQNFQEDTEYFILVSLAAYVSVAKKAI